MAKLTETEGDRTFHRVLLWDALPGVQRDPGAEKTWAHGGTGIH